MNRLLNRKKTDDSQSSNGDARMQSPTPSAVSATPKKSTTSRWKNKNRKVEEEPEPKPELNLTDILPSNDDFRTSLLMANLSQRFSMLREQDNPGSLMGKASDDSVLEPRRRSRKLDFGFGGGVSGLTDIDEVRSINSSIRPPFAGGKHESFMSGDGYASEAEPTNVMARSRPGEGNTLFGGRQKVYMIPKNGAASSNGLGKFVYNDDVGMSAFQKHRQREKELQAARDPEMPEDPSFDFGLGLADGGDEEDGLHDSVRDFSNSPSLSTYEKKRSTCSTSRSEARSSTAATSITSQPATSSVAPLPAPTAVPLGPLPAAPLERSNPSIKSRRLYDQGLDQHMQDQQSSALSRLNSLQKQRPYNNTSTKASPPFLHSAKSTGSLTERAPLRVYTSQSSPPVPALATFGAFTKPGQSPLGSGPNSPMSPTMEESSVLTQALEPADRGKATAMGAFNKPKHAFDEQQYMERQMQLQRSASSALPRQPSASALQQRMGRFEQIERERSSSNPTARPRSQSASKSRDRGQATNAFQNVSSPPQSVQGAQQPSEKVPYPDTHRTFFGNISASDSEDEGDDISSAANPYGQQDNGYNQSYGRWQPTVLPSVSEHPALRGNAPAPLVEEEAEDELSSIPHTVSVPTVHHELVAPSQDQEQDLDSPTLGPAPEGLGSMMHHLRNESNASSTYPPDETSPMPIMPDLKDYESARQSVLGLNGSDSYIQSSHTTRSNPWDLDETNSAYYNNSVTDARSPVSPMEPRNSQSARVSSRAPSSIALPTEQPMESWPDAADPSWQSELSRQHTRNASTATQQERAAFDNELAARRKAIQENVKSMVDADHSRNPSPAPTTGGAFKAFNMLRSKSSRDSFDTRKDTAAPKALKMLGLGAGPVSASISNLNTQYERGGMSLEMGRTRGESASRGPTFGRVLQQSDVDAKRERETSRARGDSEASRTGRPVGRSPASSEAGRGRGRSNSEATHGGRSRSTTGPYRDDLDRAMAQGTGSSAFGVPDLSPMITREMTPRPSPNISNKSSFETKNRSRSGSRTGAMTNYFEAKSLQASQGPQFGRPVGPSPAAMASNSFLANGGSSRGSPYMQVPTPPISGPNTPVAASPTPPPMPAGPPLRSVPLRKKTINKHEISEPVALLSSTSQVGTVDLPVGASLKNGMDTSPPPLPPVNPRRRATRKLFGMGRSDSEEASVQEHDISRSKTPDPWGTAPAATRLRNTSNPPRPFDSTPALQQYGLEQSAPPTRQFSNARSPPMHPHEHRGVTSPEPMDRPPIEGGFI